MKNLDAALLAALRQTGLYWSGSELAAHLEKDLLVIEGRIAELRGAGFEIEERPGLGYRLLASPDRLVADDLLARLGSENWIRQIVVFEETDSTNDRAAQMGREGVGGGVAIFAERQTSGRGRFGRRWESASHTGIWGSILLRPQMPLAQWPRLTTAAAVAIANALEKLVPGRVQIKWPNDLQIGGQKIAGILMEAGTDRFSRPFAVLGFGLNANQEAFTGELAQRATSLRAILGRPVDRPALTAAILGEMASVLDGQGFAAVIAEAVRRSTLLGQWVQVRALETVIEGVAEGLDADGQLLLRDGSGALQVLNAGEVTILSGGPRFT